ncbi:MAG: type VI secretion system tube protein Hcp [Planctomycetota bacterium]
MAFDAFLRIEGIPGESTDDQHKDWIEILNYTHNIEQPASATKSSAGGAGAERVNHGVFKIVKELDKATPKLAEHCCTGKPLDEVVVSLNRAGGDKVEYMEYKMKQVIVTSLNPDGDPTGQASVPIERVGFDYGSIEWTYTAQKRSDGTGGGKVAAGWDCMTNKKI